MKKNHKILISIGIVLVVAVMFEVIFQVNKGKSYATAISFIKVGQLSEANKILNNIKEYKNTDILLKYSDALKISKDDPSLDPLSNPYFPIYTIPKNYNGDLSKEITEYRTKLEQEHEKNIAEGIKDMVAKQNANTKVNALTKTQGISIGMRANEVENSQWGTPNKVNRTTTANSVSEQWVYSSSRYVYLENGIVTAIQE